MIELFWWLNCCRNKTATTLFNRCMDKFMRCLLGDVRTVLFWQWRRKLFTSCLKFTKSTLINDDHKMFVWFLLWFFKLQFLFFNYSFCWWDRLIFLTFKHIHHSNYFSLRNHSFTYSIVDSLSFMCYWISSFVFFFLEFPSNLLFKIPRKINCNQDSVV